MKRWLMPSVWVVLLIGGLLAACAGLASSTPVQAANPVTAVAEPVLALSGTSPMVQVVVVGVVGLFGLLALIPIDPGDQGRQ